MSEELEIEVPEYNVHFLRQQPLPLGYKRCSPTAIHGCGKVKPVSEFCKKAASKDGLSHTCKECATQCLIRYHKELKSGERKHIIVKTKRCRICETTFDNPYEAFAVRLGHVDKLDFVCRKCQAKRGAHKNAKKRAKEKGIPFGVTVKYWLTVYKDNCPACGVELQFAGGKMCNNSATMDKIIPSKGYVEGNLQCLCKHCNEMKLNDDSSKVVRARAKLVLKAHNYMADVMEAAEKGEYNIKTVLDTGTLTG